MIYLISTKNKNYRCHLARHRVTIAIQHDNEQKVFLSTPLKINARSRKKTLQQNATTKGNYRISDKGWPIQDKIQAKSTREVAEGVLKTSITLSNK